MGLVNLMLSERACYAVMIIMPDLLQIMDTLA